MKTGVTYNHGYRVKMGKRSISDINTYFVF